MPVLSPRGDSMAWSQGTEFFRRTDHPANQVSRLLHVSDNSQTFPEWRSRPMMSRIVELAVAAKGRNSSAGNLFDVHDATAGNAIACRGI